MLAWLERAREGLQGKDTGDTVKYYRMNRLVDHTGNSGTGYVADVVVGGPGTAIVLWSAESNALGVSSVVIYASLDDLIAVHGHGGSTVLEETELTVEQRERLRDRLRIAERKIKEVFFTGGAISFHGNVA